MRILSLGCPLSDSQIDNYDWASAPSFYDYDAVIVDPAEAVSKLVEGIVQQGQSYATYNSEPVLDGPTTAEAVGLADLLQRRRRETERFLARGGLLVVMTHPDVAHRGVSGYGGAHRYYWLPAPVDADYGPRFLEPAAGTHVAPTDYLHPFADYLESMRAGVSYRASLAEPGFGAATKVIGRSPGGAAIAAEVALAGGRVIFLPALPGNLAHSERQQIAGHLVDAIRNALLSDAEDEPPSWLSDYQLPGLVEAEKRLEGAGEKLDEAEGELTEARNSFRKVDRYRRLLWQEGKFGLELPVRDVLSELGFISLKPVDEPGAFLLETDTVFVEVEGSSGSVGMNPHYRLRPRLEESIADGRRPLGIIVVNGERTQPPSARAKPIDDSLRIAAESMRYCVVEAAVLYEAVKAKLEGHGDSAAFCRALMGTEGVFKREPLSAAEAESKQQA